MSVDGAQRKGSWVVLLLERRRRKVRGCVNELDEDDVFDVIVVVLVEEGRRQTKVDVSQVVSCPNSFHCEIRR